MSPIDWRSVFTQGIPPISPIDAYGAVLLYPEDESEIGECAAQPFVADYLEDLAEQDREIGGSYHKPSVCSSIMAMRWWPPVSRLIGREIIPCWYGTRPLRKSRHNGSGASVLSCSSGIGSRAFDSVRTKGCTIETLLTPTTWSITGCPMTV